MNKLMGTDIRWDWIAKVVGGVVLTGALFAGSCAHADTLTIIEDGVATMHTGTILSTHQDITGGLVWFDGRTAEVEASEHIMASGFEDVRWWWRIENGAPENAITGSGICDMRATPNSVVLTCAAVQGTP